MYTEVCVHKMESEKETERSSVVIHFIGGKWLFGSDCDVLVLKDGCTARRQYRKFETNIPRKEIARPLSQFPQSCVYERFIYSYDRSAYSAAGKYVNRSWEYINRLQTHECGNWG